MRGRSWIRAGVLGAVGALVAGCGGGGGDLQPDQSPLVLAKAPSESGDQQSGAVGQALPDELRIIVTRDGAPQANVPVTWSTSDGSLSPASGPTDAAGIGASAWTLGPDAGAQTAQAAVQGATGSPVTFNATGTSAAPPPPSPLVISKAPSASGDLQTGPVGEALPSPLRILVTRDGAPQPDIIVTWSTADGSLDPASAPTDAAGIGASSWTLGPDAGAQSAQAAVQGATGSPVGFGATGTAGGGPPPPPPGTTAVTIGNIFFRSNQNNTSDPAVDTVAVNGTVTWTWVNTGSEPHSVLSNGTPAFTSSDIQSGSGAKYTFKFTVAGTYTYTCAVHGPDMTGRIVVR